MMAQWIDIVTLAVPRPTIGRTIPALMEKLDRGGYRLRWIVHYDPIDCLRADYEAVLQSIRDLSARFDDSVILTPPSNIGHAASFRESLRHVENDFLYWEDDKLCTAHFALNTLVRSDGHHLSLQGRAGRPGHTSASFWRAVVAKAILESWPAAGLSSCLEDWLKRLCKRHGFRGGPRFRCAVDVGLDALSTQRVRRIRGADGNPKYAAVSEDITFATYVTDDSLVAFGQNYQTWKWRLCIDSFPFVIMAPPRLHTAVSNIVSEGRETRVIAWEPPQSANSDDQFFSFIKAVAEMANAHMATISPKVSVTKTATRLNCQDLCRYDLCGKVATAQSIQFQRTAWLQQRIREFDELSPELPFPEYLWCFAKNSGASTKVCDFRSAGFNMAN